MEPPLAAGANALRDEKARVLRAMRPLRPRDVVRGQYEGYSPDRLLGRAGAWHDPGSEHVPLQDGASP